MKKEDILELGAIGAMRLCNELGIPEGSGDEMRQALLEHFGEGEDEPSPMELETLEGLAEDEEE